MIRKPPTLLLALVFALGLTMVSPHAQTAASFQLLTVTNAATVSLTVRTTDTQALLSVETATIRFRFDGGAPTTTVGHLADPGSVVTITGHASLVAFRAIAVAATATVPSTVSQ